MPTGETVDLLSGVTLPLSVPAEDLPAADITKLEVGPVAVRITGAGVVGWHD